MGSGSEGGRSVLCSHGNVCVCVWVFLKLGCDEGQGGYGWRKHLNRGIQHALPGMGQRLGATITRLLHFLYDTVNPLKNVRIFHSQNS